MVDRDLNVSGGGGKQKEEVERGGQEAGGMDIKRFKGQEKDGNEDVWYKRMLKAYCPEWSAVIKRVSDWS